MAKNFFKIYEGVSLVARSADPVSPQEGDLQFSDGTHRDPGLWQYVNSEWSVVGSAKLDIESQTSSFTAEKFHTYLVDTSGGAITVTLPSAESGITVEIKDIGNANTNNITISTPAAETIDGSASDILQSDYVACKYACNGVNWFKL